MTVIIDSLKFSHASDSETPQKQQEQQSHHLMIPTELLAGAPRAASRIAYRLLNRLYESLSLASSDLPFSLSVAEQMNNAFELKTKDFVNE